MSARQTTMFGLPVELPSPPTPKKSRPGLHYFPDVESYDEEMRDLERKLGRKPSPLDISESFIVVTAVMAIGEPCIACNAPPKSCNRSGTYIPDPEVVEIIGYQLCDPCGAKWEANDRKLIDSAEAKLRRKLAMERPS